MKKIFLPAIILVTLATLSCGEVKEDFVDVKINGTPRHFEDHLSKWFTVDSQTQNEKFEFWCYTNSGDIDHDFLGMKGPNTAVGTHVMPCADFSIAYRTPSGTLCGCDTAYYTVTEYDQSQSLFDPFITFKGNFYARLIEQGTGNIYELTDGYFEIHEK